ncbi:MAG: peroxiredoxin-like family protein [Cyanobacteria bacterium P01_A01_bin.68]
MDLAKSLRLARRNLEENLSAETLEAIDNVTEEVISSGIAHQSLKVGDMIPDFALPNHNGELIEIKQIFKRGATIISFYRGTWCPFCNLELKALEQALPAISMLGGTVVTISPQTFVKSPQSIEEKKLNFEMLIDKRNQVARQFNIVFKIPKKSRSYYRSIGIYLPKYNGDASFELPIPATFIVNQDGKINYAYVEPDHTQRLDPVEIITNIRRMNNDDVLNS